MTSLKRGKVSHSSVAWVVLMASNPLGASKPLFIFWMVTLSPNLLTGQRCPACIVRGLRFLVLLIESERHAPGQLHVEHLA